MPALFHNGDFTEVVDLVEQNPDMKAIYIVNMGDYGVCQEIHRAARGRNLAVITTIWLLPSRAAEKRPYLRHHRPAARHPGLLPLQLLYEYLAFGTLPAKSKFFTDLHICISQNV